MKAECLRMILKYAKGRVPGLCRVQSNDNGICHDGKYEYETVCYPFLKNLGKVIYDYELHRKKKYLPDLARFMVH